MSQDKNRGRKAFAALSFELDVAVPTEAHLLPPGPFRADDGRPFDCDAWQLDEAIAGQLIKRMAAKANDTLIDFEHQSIRSEGNGKPVPAAGWFKAMEWREGRGLFAVDVTWVGGTAKLIASKEYRYISALFSYLPETGEVLEIISVALTNTPALDGLDALVALSRKFADDEGGVMPEVNPQIAALTAERDAAKAQIAALTTERDAVKAQLESFQAEQRQAALTTEKAQRDALVRAALYDGRLAPAQNDWASKQSLASLTEFFGATQPLSIATGQQSAATHTAGLSRLSDVEKAMCAKMGVTEEAYLKAKGC